MARAQLIWSSAVVAASAMVIAALYLASERNANHRYATFDRRLIWHLLSPLDTIDLKYNGFYFAGQTAHHVFLGHPASPTDVLMVDPVQGEASHIRMGIADDSLTYRSIRVQVDSPYYYLMDGLKPFVYKGMVGKMLAVKVDSGLNFIHAVPISPSSAAIAAINAHTSLLGKISWGKKPDFNASLLEPQQDGIFSTDGKLLRDSKAQLVFLYYYRNQYIAMDTSMNLLFRARTIDNIYHAHIKIGRIHSSNKVTMATPPLIVNKDGVLSDGVLYVNSNILSRNDNEELFDRRGVIDVYKLDGESRYLHSFYLPVFGQRRLVSYAVVNCLLVCLYDHFLVTFKMEEKIS